MFGCIGPLQIWQDYTWDCISNVRPLTRLYRAGNKGLPVGKGSRYMGGLATDVAKRLEQRGIVYLGWDPSLGMMKAYPCQLSFNFWN